MSIFSGSSSLLTIQRMLGINARSIATSLERLATGQRINRASDDPAGLISSEKLTATLKSLEAEARSLQRADQVATVADGALGEISGLLVEANGLAVEAANTAGMSPEEKQALQAELDGVLSAIDNVAATTSFGGDPLLDGTASITAGGSTLDIDAASTSDLGTTDIGGETRTLSDVASGGDLNLVDGDVAGAQQVIQSALTEVATARGELGSFQKNTIGARLDSVGAAIETTAAANSAVRDANLAMEIASLNRSLVLQKATLSAAGILLSTESSVDLLLGG